jgi:hypothetical protein
VGTTFFGWLILAALIVGLSGCGQTSPSGGSTGSSGGVSVDVGSGTYATTAAITATVHNALSESILATDHQTSCTIVQLQRQVNSVWQNQGGCALGIATRRVTLAAGSSTVVQVAPGAGQLSTSPWPTGAYRIAFTFQTGPLSTSVPSMTVYSPTFTVS